MKKTSLHGRRPDTMIGAFQNADDSKDLPNTVNVITRLSMRLNGRKTKITKLVANKLSKLLEVSGEEMKHLGPRIAETKDLARRLKEFNPSMEETVMEAFCNKTDVVSLVKILDVLDS